jgi:hypothetical protein
LRRTSRLQGEQDKFKGLKISIRKAEPLNHSQKALPFQRNQTPMQCGIKTDLRLQQQPSRLSSIEEFFPLITKSVYQIPIVGGFPFQKQNVARRMTCRREVVYLWVWRIKWPTNLIQEIYQNNLLNKESPDSDGAISVFESPN